MLNLMKAEMVKGRHTFVRKSSVLLPLLVSVLAIILMSGQLTQAGIYNWWYMIILPMFMIILCNSLTNSEKRTHYFNIVILPIKRRDIWVSKLLVGIISIFITNLIVFMFTNISGHIFESQYSVKQSLAAIIVLTITIIWQLPLTMFLNIKLGFALSSIIMLLANIILSLQPIAGSKLWIIPFAITSRLMAPLLQLNPNGVPLETASKLNDMGVIVPGLAITLTLFIILSLATAKWFERKDFE